MTFLTTQPVVVRRYVALEKLRTNNEVAGFKFATVGVIYAVLLAFAIVVVWERFNQADNDVAKEASGAARDWPAMAAGRPSHHVTISLTNVYEAVVKYHGFDANESLIVTQILENLDQVGDARRARLVVSTGIVPGIIWLVLFVGAFVTLAFTFFFGTANLRAQVMMSGALSVLIFGGLLTIIAIDHPFAGTVHVEPEALIGVVDDFNAGK
jgi:hypothetical protein